MSNSKELINSFSNNFKKIINENKFYLYILLAIVIIGYITYKLSYKKRVSDKLTYLNNNLIYDKPRLQLDFCGVDNSLKDFFYSGIIVNTSENSITIHEDYNENIDFYLIGLSSEFIITFDKIPNKLFKIKKLKNKHSIIFSKNENDDILTKQDKTIIEKTA